MIGLDYDGVVSEGFPIPPNAIIITNRPENHPVELPKGKEDTPVVYNKDNPQRDPDPIDSGIYKVKQIKRLGIDAFYDDDPVVAEIIKTYLPKLKVYQVTGKKVVEVS